MPQTIKFCEHQELPMTAGPAPPTPATTNNITIYKKLDATPRLRQRIQRATQYKDHRLIALYFDMTAMPPEDQHARAGCRRNICPHPDDLRRPDRHSAIYRRLCRCAAGLYRGPQPAAEHSADDDCGRRPRHQRSPSKTPAVPIPARPSGRTTASSTSSTPTGSFPHCRLRHRCWGR